MGGREINCQFVRKMSCESCHTTLTQVAVNVSLVCFAEGHGYGHDYKNNSIPFMTVSYTHNRD